MSFTSRKRPEFPLPPVRGGERETLKGETEASMETKGKPTSILALARRVLAGNHEGNRQETTPLRGANFEGNSRGVEETGYQVFEYNFDGRWLVLFSIVPGDSVKRVKNHLEQRLGRRVQVRRKLPSRLVTASRVLSAYQRRNVQADQPETAGSDFDDGFGF
jgi:hypothetical protein